jgi:hypothetical protein
MAILQQRSSAAHRRARRLKILTLAVVASGCGNSPTGPSSNAPVAFVIVAGMNVLAVGEAMPFTATAYPAGGPSNGAPGFHGIPFDVTRQATWASSDPTTVTISSNGVVTAQRPGSAEVSASYKGSSYTLTVSVGHAAGESWSGYVGTWSGVARMTCQPLRGEGRSNCDPLLSGVPTVLSEPLELQLALAGDLMSGTLSLYQGTTPLSVRAAVFDRGRGLGGAFRSGDGAVTVQLRDSQFFVTREGQLFCHIYVDHASVSVFGSQLEREEFYANGTLTRQE